MLLSKLSSSSKTIQSLLAFACLITIASFLRAATGGSISGAITDRSGAVVVGAALKLVNTAQQTTYNAVSDKQGLYTLPNLPVGHYDMDIAAVGFNAQRKTGLPVDADSALRVNASLEIGTRSDVVTVTSEAGVQVDTTATHLGEVVSGDQMTAIPLNGRSYTDPLAILSEHYLFNRHASYQAHRSGQEYPRTAHKGDGKLMYLLS